MKTQLLIASLLTSGLLFTQAASANDQAVGAVFGGITGAAIGHAIDGRGATVAGAVIGALVGSAIANDQHEYREYREYREPARVIYAPAYQSYPVYSPRPAVIEYDAYRHAPEWHHGWNDYRRDHDADRRW